MKGILRSCLVCTVCCVAIASAQTFIAGTTCSPYQHIGSCGRMIGVDDSGYVHTVWTKLISPDFLNGERHVQYNVWDPGTGSFLSSNGYRVDSAPLRAGFATIAGLPNGWVFPAYHEIVNGIIRVSAAIDLQPRMGIFTPDRVPLPFDPVPEIIWPKIAVGRDSMIHMVSTQYPPLDQTYQPYRIFYSRGIPQWDDEGYGLGIEWSIFGECGFQLVDTTTTISVVIAASRVSDRVAIAWAKPRHLRNADSTLNKYDNDLFLQMSYDGGYNWSFPENITQFIPPDSQCYEETGNARCCSRDTLRVFPDISLLFDNQDRLHIAFTTVGYYHWANGTSQASIQATKSMIWHWNDGNHIFRPVASSWLDSAAIIPHTLLPDHAMVERPSLSEDPTNHALYCVYLKYDTAAYSEAGILNADAFVSTNRWTGNQWSVGTNVTHTAPAAVPAPLGFNANEQDVSAAELVTWGNLHLFYLLDRDAGTSGDTHSLNTMYYRRISTLDSIAATPIIPAAAFHVDIVNCDSTEAVGLPPTHADKLEFHPAYPNPFNSTVTVAFTLPRKSDVKLTVYDVLGRKVEQVLTGSLAAGPHSAIWNPQKTGSGVYFFRLQTAYGERLQKVVYLR